MVSADADPPYERPPLSKDFLRGESEETDVFMHDVDFYREHDVAVRLASSVVRLRPEEGTVTLDSGDGIRFDTCIIATGAEPRRLSVPGADDPAVLQLRSLAEGRVLRATATQATSAVVIGSGFIGCEAAASLARRGLTVTLITDEDAPQQRRLGLRLPGASPAGLSPRACGFAPERRSRASRAAGRCGSATATAWTPTWS